MGQQTFDDSGRPKSGYSGKVYVKSDAATGDSARRFETSPRFLRDAVVKVSTYDQLFGDASGQTFLVSVGSNWSCNLIDISTLYFKNATAGQNGRVDILGVED